MTKSFCHYDTIPSDMMDIIETDLSKFDRLMEESRVRSGKDLERRNSLNAWIPTTYWVGGLIWHYFQRANDEFFHYDLDQIDGESMQYTKYELNQHYNWHQDEGISAQGYFRPDNLVGTNNLEISIFGNDDNNQLIILSRLDNLGKGASGAAIQCMNIALGFDETLGL